MLPFGSALAALVDALASVGVPWFVAGSVASVVHGEIRTTQDVDVVADLQPAHVPPLAAALRTTFFVDEILLMEAVQGGGSCNVIHRETGFKVDLFVLRPRPFSRVEMDRRQRIELQPGLSLPVASAEDCILTKLEWFEKGGRVSDRQWRDVLGILKAQRGALDTAYLDRWAQELGLGDLMDQAMREATGGP